MTYSPPPPSPYSTPPLGYAGVPYPASPRPFAMARRAGLLMIGLGIPALLGGGCFTLLGAVFPKLEIPPEAAANFEQLQKQLHMSPATAFLIFGIVMLAAGLYHVIMGFLVRRGGRVAIVTSIVTTLLVIGWFILNAVASVAVGTANPAAGLCFIGLILCLFGWLLSWLIQAFRSTQSQALAAQYHAQYQAQYWQYAQQQKQGHAQQYGLPPAMPYPPPPPGPNVGGWAYGAQPPPPPPQQGNPNEPPTTG